MADTSQQRALRNYRNRLLQRGLTRFEVLGRSADRELIRSLAKRLAEDEGAADRIRQELALVLANQAEPRGGILSALRCSPLVGAGLDLGRSQVIERRVDL